MLLQPLSVFPGSMSRGRASVKITSASSHPAGQTQRGVARATAQVGHSLVGCESEQSGPRRLVVSKRVCWAIGGVLDEACWLFVCTTVGRVRELTGQNRTQGQTCPLLACTVHLVDLPRACGGQRQKGLSGYGGWVVQRTLAQSGDAVRSSKQLLWFILLVLLVGTHHLNTPCVTCTR